VESGLNLDASRLHLSLGRTTLARESSASVDRQTIGRMAVPPSPIADAVGTLKRLTLQLGDPNNHLPLELKARKGGESMKIIRRLAPSLGSAVALLRAGRCCLENRVGEL
jgi:hypothetical protein